MKLNVDLSNTALLDREIGSANRAWGDWLAKLAADAGAAALHDPIAAYRSIASGSLYAKVAERRARQPDDSQAPLFDAMARWVAELTCRRISRAAIASDFMQRELARTVGRDGGLEESASWNDGWKNVLVGPNPARWFGVLASIAPEIASARRETFARRHEVLRRLGIDSGADYEIGVDAATVVASAEKFLKSTDRLMRDVIKHARSKAESHEASLSMPLFTIRLSLARDATEGWPAQLNRRWLESLFMPFAAGLSLTLPPLPAPLGGSSFVRALAQFGRALADAAPSPSLPFVLGHDPYAVRPHRVGAAFAALACTTEFQKRALSVGRSSADQSRIAARTALFSARVAAAQVVLKNGMSFDDAAFALFGEGMPQAFAGAWPCAHADDVSRWVGMTSGQTLFFELRAKFDADWFRNPRAVTHMRSVLSAPISSDAKSEPLLEGGALAAVLEEALA